MKTIDETLKNKESVDKLTSDSSLKYEGCKQGRERQGA